MTNRSWQRNLCAIFIAELLASIGMNAFMPFLSLLVQELGSFSNKEAAFWGGVALGISGIGMFLTAPLWGILADRSGRKPMVIRAMFGSGIVVALLAFAPNVFTVIVLRFLQGSLSGILAATSALVATTTPREKLPFAMSILALAKFGGGTLGPLVGGFMADGIGFKNTFLLIAAIITVGVVIVLVFVEEKFERPTQAPVTSLRSLWHFSISRQLLPILAVEFALVAAQQMMMPIVPLIIKDIAPGTAVATKAGLAFGLMGVIGAVVGLVTGRLGEHIKLKKILLMSCIAGILFYLPPIWAVTVTQLIVMVGLLGIAKGGLTTSASALVGLSISHTQQGLAYGVVQSSKALGNGVGPLLGGGLAQLLGLRAIFGVAAGFFALAGVLVKKQLSE